MQTQKPRIAAFYVLLVLLGLGFVLVAAELTGKFLLERQGGSPYGLFFQARENASVKRVFLFPLIDPLLGWGRNPPFHAYYSDPVPASQRDDAVSPGKGPAGTVRIVGLGGSTTDPEMEAHNWVYQLAGICGAKGLRCQTLNGGIGGYASQQELLKLERDVLPLEPDLVISLNGINDESLNVFDGRTFVNNHQQAIEKALRVSDWDADSPLASPPSLWGPFPHARFLLRVIGFALSPRLEHNEPIGVRDGYSLARRWETNVRMMHALAQEFGFRYFVFLQPHLGLEPEAAQAKIRENGFPYMYDVNHLQTFYEEARAACRKLSYCADISGELTGKSALFKDVMHVNEEGHRLEAEKMFRVLREKKLL